MKQNRVYIAGAHSRGVTLGHYLQYLDSDIEILAYLYDNKEKNPQEIDGVPVLFIDGNTNLDVECPTYIATRGAEHAPIRETLSRCGITKIIPITPEKDLQIRNLYLRKYFSSVGRCFEKVDELMPPKDATEESNSSFRIYVANSALDKALENAYTLAPYESKLQVGAALTDQRINARYVDCEGENISFRNAQFCELTGLYWIWKNAIEDVVGLAHYRRHFLLPEDWFARMQDSDIDVILPTPLYVGPSLAENYRMRHVASNWKYMLEFVRQRDENEYKDMLSFFEGTALYSPCNMLIAKKPIFDELCEWMFPILFAVAEKGGQLDDRYQNRYPGFLSERMMTYFFEKNRERYHVVYADKNFLL